MPTHLTHLRIRLRSVDLGQSVPTSRSLIDDRGGIIHADMDTYTALNLTWHQPRLMQMSGRHWCEFGDPCSNEAAFRVVILALFDRSIGADAVDARGAGLHPDLGPMDSRLIIEEGPRKVQPHGAPREIEGVDATAIIIERMRKEVHPVAVRCRMQASKNGHPVRPSDHASNRWRSNRRSSFASSTVLCHDIEVRLAFQLLDEVVSAMPTGS